MFEYFNKFMILALIGLINFQAPIVFLQFCYFTSILSQLLLFDLLLTNNVDVQSFKTYQEIFQWFLISHDQPKDSCLLCRTDLVLGQSWRASVRLSAV